MPCGASTNKTLLLYQADLEKALLDVCDPGVWSPKLSCAARPTPAS